MIGRNSLWAAGAVVAGLMLSSPAMAQYDARTAVDLNLRVGPGTEYGIIDVIPAGYPVDVLGCLDAYEWCDIEWDGLRGWVFARYLVQPGTTVYLPQYAPRVGVPIITFSFGTYHDRYYRDRPWFRERQGRWRGRDYRRDSREERTEDRREQRQEQTEERREERREQTGERREERQEQTGERREERQEQTGERRDERQKQTRERREQRRERTEQRRENQQEQRQQQRQQTEQPRESRQQRQQQRQETEQRQQRRQPERQGRARGGQPEEEVRRR